MGSVKADKLRKKYSAPPDGECWSWRTPEFLMSEAWRTAPLQTRRFVERLEIEHLHQGRVENGNLICTYKDCLKHGISAKKINATIKDAVRRGLVYQTQEGTASSNKRGRRPNTFGLGWIGGKDGSAPPNLWKAWTRNRAPGQAPHSKLLKVLPHGGCKLKGGFLPKKNGDPRIKYPTGDVVKYPTGDVKENLPPGWSVKRGRIVTDDGITVPIVDDPMIGDAKERDALARYQHFLELMEQQPEGEKIANGCQKT
jgi:hypothetical protein